MDPNFMDAQEAMGFLVSQTSYIESQVVETLYPDIQYPTLIPVDTSADEWAKSVTYYSSDRNGRAGWYNHLAKDIHFADVERAQHEVGIEMADIGYYFTLQEIGMAMRIPGQNLQADRAEAARRAYEEFLDDIIFRGDAAKNFFGFMNYPGVDSVMVAADGDGDLSWEDKTPDEILTDINAAIIGQYVSTNTVEMADTLLLPVAAMGLLASKRLTDTSITVLSFLQANNVYTHQTGQALTIRAVRGLDVAGAGGTGRMIVYRRDPQVLKVHLPMPHRFLPPFQTGPLRFDVPGIFRLAGLDIRRPKAVRYVDGVLDAPYE